MTGITTDSEFQSAAAAVVVLTSAASGWETNSDLEPHLVAANCNLLFSEWHSEWHSEFVAAAVSEIVAIALAFDPFSRQVSEWHSESAASAISDFAAVAEAAAAVALWLAVLPTNSECSSDSES